MHRMVLIDCPLTLLSLLRNELTGKERKGNKREYYCYDAISVPQLGTVILVGRLGPESFGLKMK